MTRDELIEALVAHNRLKDSPRTSAVFAKHSGSKLFKNLDKQAVARAARKKAQLARRLNAGGHNLSLQRHIGTPSDFRRWAGKATAKSVERHDRKN